MAHRYRGISYIESNLGYRLQLWGVFRARNGAIQLDPGGVISRSAHYGIRLCRSDTPVGLAGGQIRFPFDHGDFFRPIRPRFSP